MDVDSGLPGRVVGRIRRDVPLAALDALLVLPAYLIPLVFRFHGQVPSENWLRFWQLLPAIVAIHLFSNYRWRLYGQMWRYASVQEARRVLLAGLCSFVAVVVLDVVARRVRPARSRSPWSRSGARLAVMAFGAIRFQSRLFGYRRRVAQAELTRVLLMGVGDAGAQVLTDVLRDPEEAGFQVVALIDDDPRTFGRSLHGLTVMGDRSAIPDARPDVRGGPGAAGDPDGDERADPRRGRCCAKRRTCRSACCRRSASSSTGA